MVCQSIDKWVTTAVQHGQGGGDDKETVGEWAWAVSESQTQGSHKMRKPAQDKWSVDDEKNESHSQLFPEGRQKKFVSLITNPNAMKTFKALKK